MATTPTSGSFLLPQVGKARVSDAMHPGVITCAADTPLRDVARTMAMRHIHCLVVEAPSGAGWGLITGIDLVGASISGFEERTAGEAAATEPVTVSTDDTLARAAQLMIEHHVEHLVVVGAADGRPAGVLSSLDIAGVMAWGEV